MTNIDRIAAHPLDGAPYDKLEFVRLDQNRAPLYRVKGCDAPASGALDALGRAFARYGGKCFYCPTKFTPQALSLQGAHRDHVVPKSRGGSGMLHNLVIACSKCDRTKANHPIHDFRPIAAKDYLAALEKHIAASVKAAGSATA